MGVSQQEIYVKWIMKKKHWIPDSAYGEGEYIFGT